MSMGLFLNSCYYDTLVEEPVQEIPNDPDDPNYVEISFNSDIQPIFNNNCVGCHSVVNPNLTAGNAYTNLVPEYVTAGDSDASKLYNQISSGHGDASNNDIELIKAWIEQGAKNN